KCFFLFLSIFLQTIHYLLFIIKADTTRTSVENDILFEESVSSNIFNSTRETIIENPSSSPVRATASLPPLNLSSISWNDMTRKQKHSTRKRARLLKKNKNVSIKKNNQNY
ncbi:MAG: hypothetical protein GY705_02485, partial [Bacteroidetes bacterium]|nr:hypothetical protein [Bacteroidota bacterium]